MLRSAYRLEAYTTWVLARSPETPWLATLVEPVETGTDLRIVLEQGSPIRGRVLDASGKPLFGYEIRPAGGVRTSGSLVTTDLEGQFELAVPRHATCELEVRRPGRVGPVLHVERGAPAGTVDVLIQLLE